MKKRSRRKEKEESANSKQEKVKGEEDDNRERYEEGGWRRRGRASEDQERGREGGDIGIGEGNRRPTEERGRKWEWNDKMLKWKEIHVRNEESSSEVRQEREKNGKDKNINRQGSGRGRDAKVSKHIRMVIKNKKIKTITRAILNYGLEHGLKSRTKCPAKRGDAPAQGPSS